MKILMVTPELTPFAKTGGLADAVASLAIALKKKNHDVRVVMPRYYKIDRKELEHIPGPMAVHLGVHEYWTGVYESVIPGSAVKVYFIDHESSFGRDGIYGSTYEPDFADNPKRFSILSHAAFQICKKQNWFPDVIHAHDWPTALTTALLKFGNTGNEFAKTGSVFTIHNIGYQGVYGKQAFSETGLDWQHFYSAGFDDWDRINFLKAGIVSANKLTTVSPAYATEIQQAEFGFRMDGVLRYRSDDLQGILNGVDTKIWNPKTDKLIAKKYSLETISDKAENKLALQKKMGLEENSQIPVFGMVTRLVDQKGVSELFGPAYGSAFRICSDIKLQLVVLGSGDAWCEDELVSLSNRLPNMSVYIGYDEELSHLIEAGSDFFIMPSRYEPCGLNQMYSMLYGTLPIVRKTGGLSDTVECYNEETGDGTGFVFEYLSPQSIYDTVGWASYAWYNKKEHIAKMQKRGMESKFGWDVSAAEYIKVYKNAIEARANKD